MELNGYTKHRTLNGYIVYRLNRKHVTNKNVPKDIIKGIR